MFRFNDGLSILNAKQADASFPYWLHVWSFTIKIFYKVICNSFNVDISRPCHNNEDCPRLRDLHACKRQPNSFFTPSHPFTISWIISHSPSSKSLSIINYSTYEQRKHRITNCNSRDVNMLPLYRELYVAKMEGNRLSNVINILFLTLKYYRFKKNILYSIICFTNSHRNSQYTYVYVHIIGW